VNTLPSAAATPAGEAARHGPDAAAVLRALQRHTERQAEVADVLRRQRCDLLHWQDQLLRQSARLLVLRARIDWGFFPGLPARPLADPVEAAPWASRLFPQAHQVICRTGCEQDADHWREGEQCRRTGQVCDRTGGEGSA
jgi:hypothetical protein